MRVLVGIIANDAGRFSEFSACVTKLLVPQGSSKEWVIGGDWCGARNELASRCLEEGYDFLWFMDDDHSFAPDLLQRLLAHQVALVNPLCLTRVAPFHLVTFAANPDPDSTLRYLPISLDGVAEEGLVEIEAGGCAGMLIRRDVLEAIPPPWFEYTDRSEDIVFCEKAKAAGFQLYADLSCRLGHITTAVVQPAVGPDGQWGTGITVGRDMTLMVPRAELLLPEEENPGFVSDEVIPSAEEPPHPFDFADDMIIGQEIMEEEFRKRCERIEIWKDDEHRWWWRAIGHDGAVLRKDSGVNEQTVIGAAHLFFPGVGVHQVQRETDDSRFLRQYRVPGRMWDRG